jgi:formylglycine-generating enzyme required for sulfatase activity
MRTLRGLFLCGLTIPALAQGEFSPFKQAIPDTDQVIAMVPVEGGSFTMGSPEDEQGRDASEGPRHEVSVADFWMGQYEINWQQYELFVYRDEDNFNKLAPQQQLDALAIDGVTGATAPYVEMSYGMGKQGYPAINVTQYAALQYARWLSAKTGRFYRLPTEAEWEYACRAGTTTPWSFGGDAGSAGDYTVYKDNSEHRYAKTGSRQPNPWQLYDMHGNVAEWTLDQFDPTFYASSSGDNPWNRPTELYPRVVRGGSFRDPLEQTRCAARRPSATVWKERDPQIPKSNWWLTNAPFVGFRLVSPRVQPGPEEIQRYWLEAIEDFGI